MTLDRLLVRPPNWYAEQGVEVLTGQAVSAIDPSGRIVSLPDSGKLRYAKLALTTGVRARRLPAAIGGNLRGVHTMRDLGDADGVAPHFQPGKRLLIVGGGYIR